MARLTRDLLTGRSLARPRRLFPYGVPDPSMEPSLDLWLKADPLALNDGDPVSTWIDSSRSGLNYGAAGSARPTFKTNIVNGWPIVRFATDDVLTPSGAALTYGEDNTLAVICTERTSGTGYILAGSGAQGGPAFITGFSSRDFEYFFTATVGHERQTFATTAAAGFHLLVLVREDGGAFNERLQGYFDGARAFDVVVNGLDNWSTQTLSKIGDFSAGDFYNGDIAEIMHFRCLFGPRQLNNLSRYAFHKYGISTSLI